MKWLLWVVLLNVPQGSAPIPGEQHSVVVTKLPPVSVAPDWIAYASFGLTIFLVIVTAGTLVAVWYQARKTADAAEATQDAAKATQEATEEIRRQADIMDRQAKATLLNAQALINTERPWLVVTWASDKTILGLFRFGCRNQGNTPAKVISVSARPCFVKRLAELEIPPNYPGLGTLPDRNIIVHGDRFPIEHGVDPQKYILNNGKKDLIDSSEEFLVYYGNVVYRDTFYADSSLDGLHETRWCFFFRPYEGRFVRSGPEEYNRYT
jgi:hypothetical protein